MSTNIDNQFIWARIDDCSGECAMATALHDAAEVGDTLLSLEEAIGRLPVLSAAHPILIPADWVDVLQNGFSRASGAL